MSFAWWQHLLCTTRHTHTRIRTRSNPSCYIYSNKHFGASLCVNTSKGGKRQRTFANYPQQKPLFLLIYLMRKQQFINDLWAGDQMLPYVHKTRHQFCTFQQDTGTIWDWDTTRSDLLTAAALICPFGHLSSPSTWIRFKRVTHTSLCASRITHKEGSSRPANMTVQKSFLLFARKRSQEVEEDINKIRIRFF